MKRRALILPLAGIMLAALTVPALAEGATITSDAAPQTIQVNGRFVKNEGTTTPTVYSVDIEWGSMMFEYVTSSSRTWNPQTHTYSDGATGAWRPAAKGSAALDSNAIKITNHSNTDVTCVLDFQPQPWFSIDHNANATFSQNNIVLKNAEGRSPENADSNQVNLSITADAINATLPEGYYLGTISVSIQ